MSRLIQLVRLCLDCGYMSEQEAWEHILRAGGRIWRSNVSVRRFLMECLSLAEKCSSIHNEASIV